MKKQMRIAATLAAGVLVCGALLFSGCEKDGANNSGKIDCYSINGQTYQTWTQKVYEYKNENNEVIYTDTSIDALMLGGYINAENLTVRVYKQRNATECKDYSFSKYVGNVTVEKNLYLDMNSKTLDEVIKINENKFENGSKNGEETNNQEAFNKIKKNGYYSREINGKFSTQQNMGIEIDYSYGEQIYLMIYLDLAENSLERHEYTIFSESDTITYRAKWF